MKGHEKIQDAGHNGEHDQAASKFFLDAYNLTSDKCREFGKASVHLAEPINAALSEKFQESLQQHLDRSPKLRNYYDQTRINTNSTLRDTSTITNAVGGYVRDNPEDSKNAALCGLGTAASEILVLRSHNSFLTGIGLLGVTGFSIGTVGWSVHPGVKWIQAMCEEFGRHASGK